MLIAQSINQIKFVVPYVASESEARVGGAMRSVHVHCEQCQSRLRVFQSTQSINLYLSQAKAHTNTHAHTHTQKTNHNVQ